MLQDGKSGNRKESIVHLLESDAPLAPNKDENVIPMKKTIGIFAVVAIVGIVSGFGASLVSRGSANSANSTQSDSGKPIKEKAGIADTKTFKDSAQGILKPGGIDGEGEYHLERPGGPSQNVYLTSTTVDLSEYVDQKVKVMGETFSAEKAGWFMDVGFIELAK